MLLLLSAPALAWTHTGWLVDPMPLTWYRAEGTLEGISEEAFHDAFESAFSQWSEATSCTTLEVAYGGTITGDADSSDGLSAIYPVDPSVEGMIVLTTTSITADLVFSAGGMDYYASNGSDITFSGAGVIAAADLADCADELVLETFALRTTGLMLGLALYLQQQGELHRG